MKRICIVLSNDCLSEPKGGGARIMAIIEGLRKSNFDISLVFPAHNAKLSEKLQDIDAHSVPANPHESLIDLMCKVALITHKAIKIRKHYNTILQFENPALAGYAALNGASDFILDVHDLGFGSMLFEGRPLFKTILYHLEKIGVKHASRIIVVSNPMKSFIMNEWNVPENRISVIPNGYSESKLKRFQNFEEEEGAVSFIGFLHPKLDVSKFIRVGESLKGKGGRLYIIGEGPIKNILKQRIAKNNLADNIVLTGYLLDKEAYTLLARSQVAILPLRANRSINTEVMCPIKVFEYAALGKAMVLDDVSEVCRIFKENDAALVSDPSDSEKFIENVNILLNDKNLRRKISENAKKLVKNFSWEKLTEKIVDIYENSIIG